MLGTIHWMTPTDAVPELCIEMRSPVVVTGSKLTELNWLIAVGSPLWLLTSVHALPSQYWTTHEDGGSRPPPSSAQ